jgi:hypothetical protein
MWDQLQGRQCYSSRQPAFLLKGSDASPSDPSISHIRETLNNVNGTSHVAQHVQQEGGAAVRSGDMKMFSVA